MCVSDNGTELTGMAILRWSQETRVEWRTSRRESRIGMPSFKPNGRLRDELLKERCSLRSPMCERRWRSGRTTAIPSGRQRARRSRASYLCQTQRSRDATGRDAALR